MFPSKNSILYKCVVIYLRVSDATSIHLFIIHVIPYFHLSGVDKFYFCIVVYLDML